VSEQITIANALTAATKRLEQTSTSARIDAESLLCHTLKCNTAHLAAWPEKILNTDQTQQFNQLIAERESGTPISYLTGQREFWSLELGVSPVTLIPRPETETLVEFVLEQFDAKKEMRLVDLGTGSGAIALAIAHERPDWKVTATDISEDALAVAQQNAEKHHIKNIEFKSSHWFDALKGQTFDIIISNPPYIAQDDPHLSSGDVRFEPASALSSGVTGMDDIEIITSTAAHYLKDNGWLILEHGYDQKKQVFDCFKSAGFEDILQKSDLSNQPRMTAGRYISA
jgi:release factor glutamine methyltransferase